MFNMLPMDNTVAIDKYRYGISLFALSSFQYFVIKLGKQVGKLLELHPIANLIALREFKDRSKGNAVRRRQTNLITNRK
jgi:hypothetical protein